MCMCVCARTCDKINMILTYVFGGWTHLESFLSPERSELFLTILLYRCLGSDNVSDPGLSFHVAF